MTIQFTRNYSDRSNDTGFQFEFHCDKCGNGHMSTFQTNKLGMASHFIKAAGAIFGGGLHSAGWGADHVKDAFRGPAWDSAFRAAVEEMKPKFRQCTRCGTWVCPQACWNEKRTLCEACAPDLHEEAAHIQAKVAVEQAWDKARQGDHLRGFDVNAPNASAACPHCNARIEGTGPFCTSCGKPRAPAATAKSFCAQCGGELAATAKFCAGCGTPAPPRR